MRILNLILCAVVLASCARESNPSLLPASVTNGASVRSGSTGFTHLFSFDGMDGAHPEAGLIDVNGTLFGTTAWGGNSACNDDSGEVGCGTVFAITTSGKERVLYKFKGYPTDGEHPHASLIDVNDTFYGTTACYGDAAGDLGTVFDVTASGTESVLYNFNGTDGACPEAGLIDVNGKLYGTTESGTKVEDGAVFVITTSGKERVLHSFIKNRDGEAPEAGLTDVDGILYGTTLLGGKGDSGTVFEITTSGKERVLYSFGRYGVDPSGGLIDVDGTLYGTTYDSNGHDRGIVFKITTSGVLTKLYGFKGGTDGAGPVGDLTAVNGALYGVTSAGGGSNKCQILYGYPGCGTIFKITGSGVETILYRFTAGTDGAYPNGGLLEMNGKLFGTTGWGGSGTCAGNSGDSGCGTVFSVAL